MLLHLFWFYISMWFCLDFVISWCFNSHNLSNFICYGRNVLEVMIMSSRKNITRSFCNVLNPKRRPVILEMFLLYIKRYFRNAVGPFNIVDYVCSTRRQCLVSVGDRRLFSPSWLMELICLFHFMNKRISNEVWCTSSICLLFWLHVWFDS